MNLHKRNVWAAALLLCGAGGLLAQPPTTDPLARATPTWFDDAKLGIFIHWPVGSIPAFAAVNGQAHTPVTAAEAFRAARLRRSPGQRSSWLDKSPYTEFYPASMLVAGSATARYHAEHYGDMPYERLVEQFRDEVLSGWDPAPWADLFARAGARYVVFTARLDDGFLFWPSAHRNPHKQDWQSTRDVVGEFSASMRARGMRPGFYYAGGMDFTFSGIPMNTAAPQPVDALTRMLMPRPGDRFSEQQRAYVNAHWRELIERYKPDVVWNDYFYPGEMFAELGAERPLDPRFKEEVEDLFRFYVTRVPEGVINNRFDIYWQSSGQIYTDFVTLEYNTDPESGFLGRPRGSKRKWEVNRSLGTAYGYNRLEDDKTYMSAADLIHMLVDVVARGGNLLINVGPMSSGEIPWPQAQRLLELGWWLRTNGGAIYGTQPWDRSDGMTGEGLEVRYTSSTDAVFAILLGTPKSRVVELDLHLDSGVAVTLEGTSRKLQWQTTPAGIRVELAAWPEERPALTLRLSPRTGVRPQ